MFDKLKKRFAERKKKKERTVISYEDMPLEDYEQEKTQISPKAVKKIILGVVVALVVGLIVFAFANRDKLTWDNIAVWWNYEVLGTAGKGFPVNVVGSEVEAGNFAVNQGRVAYASDTSFITLNSTAREINNQQPRTVISPTDWEKQVFRFRTSTASSIPAMPRAVSWRATSLLTEDTASSATTALTSASCMPLTRTTTEYTNILFRNITLTVWQLIKQERAVYAAA